MAGWFGGKPQCPVDAATKEWIDRRWAWLVSQFGVQRLREVQVILPHADYFPEAYSASEEDTRVLLDRVCAHMDIDPASVEISLYQDRNPIAGQRTAGIYQPDAGKYRIWVEVSNLTDPLAMVATLAHELGHIHLLGHGRITEESDDHEPLTDLLTVFLGMGVFTANSVIREKNWNAGYISGWSITRQGYMSMPMFGYAFALFARDRNEDHPTWLNQLRTDVRSAFAEARAVLADNDGAIPILEAPTAPQELESHDEDSDLEEREGNALGLEILQKRIASGEREFQNVKLCRLRLCGIDLRGCKLRKADFCDADLTGAVLANADLYEADAQGTNFRGADFRGANVQEVDFSEADLSSADFTGADIRGADFSGARLHETILVGTIRNYSTNLSYEDLSTVICDADLTREDLRGSTISDQIIGQSEGVPQWGSNLVGITLGFCCGCMLGLVVGAVLASVVGNSNLREYGGFVGAIAGAGWIIRNQIRKR